MKYRPMSRQWTRSLAACAALLAVLATGARADDLQTGPPPTPPTTTLAPDAKTAKDALAKLANSYQTANDLTYKSTLVVNGPPTTDGKPPASETLLITGAVEKPNKFSISGIAPGEVGRKKLAEFLYSNGTDAYTYDPRSFVYAKLGAPADGIDLPQLHAGGLAGAVDYSAEYAARMFFDDQPYDLSESATEDTDVQFASADKMIGSQAVLAITETYTGDHGVTTTLHVALDKTSGLPRQVSEDLTTNGQTNTVFKEDFNSIHVGALPDDAGTYAWVPKAGTVTNWAPPPGTAGPADSNDAPPPTATPAADLNDAPPIRDAANATGAVAPNFTAQNSSGGSIHLSDYKGKVVVVDFWATWCGPCMQAMPNTNQVASDYHSRGVVFLAVCSSDTLDNFNQFVSQHPGMALTLLMDPAARNGAGISGSKYGVNAIPTQFVIGKDGRVVASFVGEDPSDTNETPLRQAVNQALSAS